MRTALFLALLSGLLFAQYQNYPKFYATPSQTWTYDNLDSNQFLIDTIETNGMAEYNAFFISRSDSLGSAKYVFKKNRLLQKSFLFRYRGDIDSTFYLVDKHNKGLLWLYMKDPQPSIVTDTSIFWHRYSKPEIINYLKNGYRYLNRYNLTDGNVIEMDIWYFKDLNVCYGELTFSSREFIRKEGD